jgi:ADP-heptose:LPS heptosyltransferase
MFTAHVSHPFGNESVYLQHCRCLEKAGLPFTQAEFHVQVNQEGLRAAEISEADKGNYFHISPFTTSDSKELPPTQLAELIVGLAKKFPQKKVAISCAPTQRELEKLKKLLALLPQKPWRVFAGQLNLAQLAAVIQHSAVHFCGDTGTLHLAVMTQTPTVAWFWPNPGLREWIPIGEKHRVVVGALEPGSNYLCNIGTDALIGAVPIGKNAGAVASDPIFRE